MDPPVLLVNKPSAERMVPKALALRKKQPPSFRTEWVCQPRSRNRAESGHET